MLRKEEFESSAGPRGKALTSIMASQADDELTASKTEGYKAGEKKTVEEYAKLGM